MWLNMKIGGGGRSELSIPGSTVSHVTDSATVPSHRGWFRSVAKLC